MYEWTSVSLCMIPPRATDWAASRRVQMELVAIGEFFIPFCARAVFVCVTLPSTGRREDKSGGEGAEEEEEGKKEVEEDGNEAKISNWLAELNWARLDWLV